MIFTFIHINSRIGISTLSLNIFIGVKMSFHEKISEFVINSKQRLQDRECAHTVSFMTNKTITKTHKKIQ